MPEFTTDWFSGAIPGFRQTLSRVSPLRSVLEIGSWEGRSTCWLLDEFPDLHVTCVDTFEGSTEHHPSSVAGIESRFLANTARFGERVCVRRGRSSEVLYSLATPGVPCASFDAIYVDGSHEEIDVLTDLVLAFGLLRSGGALLVDDYGGAHEFADPVFPGVHRAVDTFRRVFKDVVECVHESYQIHFIKSAGVV